MALAQFLENPQRDTLRLELLDGEIHRKPELEPASLAIASWLGAKLDEFGFAGVEARIILEGRNGAGAACPIPDVVLFMNKPQLQADLPVSTPQLVVDILPPKPHRRSTRKRVNTFITAGVRAVWVVDTARRCVDVYETGGRRRLTGTDRITAHGVAGLALPVSALFLDVEEAAARAA